MRKLLTTAVIVVCGLTFGCRAKTVRTGPVSRVVTLTPSATEIVAKIGGLDLLVGVDRYSVYPEAVKQLPKVGDFMHPSFEAIITLKPHLVILDRVQNNIVAKLNGAGIRTLVLRMHTIADVLVGLRKVGKAIGRDQQAKAVVAELTAELSGIRARVRTRTGKNPHVLALLGREVGTLKTMVAAGPGSYLDELLQHLNATNALAGAAIRYPRISVEQIMRSRPDVILDAVRPHQVTAARADWAKLSRVPAVKHQRIYTLTDQLFMSPGPRIVEALTKLEKMLYPTKRR